jgi:mono/diheme cytochrome c family protein
MKTKVIILLVLVATLTFACSESGDPANIASVSAETQTYKSVGVIKSIDVDSRNVTVDHEEIPGYMPAMEMTEPVAELSLLEGLNPGDKVEFDLRREGSKLTFAAFKKVGEVALGSEIYTISCAVCHGVNGEGAEGGIPLTKGHALHHSETEHIKQVTNGEGEKMPTFREKLTPEQIKEVVRFVREDIQKKAKRDDSSKHKH